MGSGLEIDESLLSGESDPVAKKPGDQVLSGSFVASGARGVHGDPGWAATRTRPSWRPRPACSASPGPSSWPASTASSA